MWRNTDPGRGRLGTRLLSALPEPPPRLPEGLVERGGLERGGPALRCGQVIILHDAWPSGRPRDPGGRPLTFGPMPARVLLAFSLGLLLWLLPHASMAAGPYQDRSVLPGVLPAESDLSPSSRREPQRLVAATLTLAVGAFAARRLYFGTDVK